MSNLSSLSKPATVAILTSCALVFIGASAPGQSESIIFEDTFDETEAGAPPGIPPWTSLVDGETRGTVTVVLDEENRFGRGASNRILFWDAGKEDVASELREPMDLFADNVFGENASDLVTFSFDLFEPGYPNLDDFISLIPYAGDGQPIDENRAQRIAIGKGRVGGAAGSTGSYGGPYFRSEVARVDVVVNNRSVAFTHTVRGVQYDIPMQAFQVWIDGHLAHDGYDFREIAMAGPIQGFRLNTTSSNQIKAWFDDFTVRNEAFVRDPDPAPVPGSVIWYDDFDQWEEDGRLGGPWTAFPVDNRGLVERVPDTENRFGRGPDNRVLLLEKFYPPSSVFRLQTAPMFPESHDNEVITVSMDYIFPEEDFDETDFSPLNPPSGQEIKLFLHSYADGYTMLMNSEPFTVVQRIVLQPGRLGPSTTSHSEYPEGLGVALTPDTLVRADIIVNNSADPVTHTVNGEEYTVLASTYQVWIDGELAIPGTRHTHLVPSSPITHMRFEASSSHKMKMWMDDFNLRKGAFVRTPTVFEDTFDNVAAGGPPGEPWTGMTTDEARGTRTVILDEEDWFGRGTDNQILETHKYGDGVFRLTADPAISEEENVKVATVSFDYIMPVLEYDPENPLYIPADPEEFAGQTQEYKLFVFSGADSFDNLVQRLTMRPHRFGPSSDVETTAGELYRVDAIINNSADPVMHTVNGTEYTVHPATYQLWLNGTLAAEAIQHDNRMPDMPITHLRWEASGGNRVLHYMDSFAIRNEPFVRVASISEAFTAWLATHFTPEELEDESVGGITGDGSGDGLSNLLVYALGGNPRMSERDRLPTVAIESLEVEGATDSYLTLVFERPADATDVSYSVAAGSELGSWVEDAVQVSATEDGGIVTEVWRDLHPIGESDRHFLRLEVSLN